MFLRQGDKIITEAWQIATLCDPLNIERGTWNLDALDEAVCQQAAQNPVFQAHILDAIQAPLSALKTKNGYLTEDIVCINAETPDLPGLLKKFEQEHHHTDDEVRVILHGEGVFGIVPGIIQHQETGQPFEIHMQAGDLIVVPAYTRHWFTLTSLRQVVALRVFKTPAGWTALYNKALTRASI